MRRRIVAALWLLSLAACASALKDSVREQSAYEEEDTEALKTRCLEGDDEACLDVRRRRLKED